MISVTERAAQEIRSIMQEQKLTEGYGVRVGVVGGGCSGLNYTMNFQQEAKSGEKVFESNGVKIFVDLKSYLYLQGTSLDFSDGLNNRGFVFTNPNAQRTCGCGSSFSV